MKKNISARHRKLKRFLVKHRARVRAVLIVGLMAIIGVILLVVTRAAVPFANIELEKGSNITAQILSGNGSSGNQYVKFANRSSNDGNAATGKFYIVGNQIVSPEGKVFVPNGVNGAISYGYVFNYRGSLNGKSNEVKAWGWNIVRPTLQCRSANGAGDINAMNASLDALIDEYTAKKIVVMPECHDYTGSVGLTDVSALYPFLDRLVTKYADNPYVWVNLLNEPYQSSSATDVNQWLGVNSAIYDRVRSKSADKIVVADIVGYGQAAELLRDPNGMRKLGNGRCNVMYSWHNYGSVGWAWSATPGVGSFNPAPQESLFNYLRDNKIPVMLGEVGAPISKEESTTGSGERDYGGANASMDFAPSRGIGILWWHATGDSGDRLRYSLMTDRSAPWSALPNGTGLTDIGKKFWNISRANHSQADFKGNLAESGCTSVK